MKPGRRILLFTLGAAHSLNHSFFVILPPLLPLIILETGVSMQSIGIVVNLGYLAYGSGALVGGLISDRVGENRVLTVSIGLSGASTAIIYFFPNIVGLGIGFFTMSVWASFYHPTATSLISKVFTYDTGKALGVHGAWGTLGITIFPSAAVALGMALGWHSAFLFFGALSIFVSLFFSRFPSYRVSSARSSQQDQPSVRTGLLKVFQIPGLWVLLFFRSFIGLFHTGIEFILPTFLVQQREFSIEMAGVAVSVLLAFGVLGQLLGGKSADLIGNKRFLILSSIGALIGLIFIQIIQNFLIGVVLFIIFYGILSHAHQPAFNSLVASITSTELRGTMYGLLFFFTFGLGSPSATLAGYLADTRGLSYVMIALTLFASINLITSFFLPKDRERTFIKHI
ncbi:MAG: MFS transporter [Nitrososphaeria archaeon]|nr:MFS transporter [Nitrososphaeria archaeon]NIQ33018.1 MFS transporter [Nitrososphaeria archaeon]